jgi:N-acetylglucosaminyl-diphospho-decaprenol L-rhamnosyltransferase
MLSIIIVNFKNPPLLRLCLKSILKNINSSFEYEVVVVDSQSTAETRNVVLEEYQNLFKKITLIPFKENIGYTKGVNEGIKASSGEYILNLNPDIVIQEGSVEKMVEHLKAHPEIGILGPKLLNIDGTIQDTCFRFYSPLTVLYRRIGFLPFSRRVLDSFLMRDFDREHIMPVDWVMGSALLFKRSSADKVGPLDEKMFLYMSEVDWARRFWENGYQVVYYPLAQLYHYWKRESKGKFWILDLLFKKETRWHIMDALTYFRKYGFFNQGSRIKNIKHSTNAIYS